MGFILLFLLEKGELSRNQPSFCFKLPFLYALILLSILNWSLNLLCKSCSKVEPAVICFAKVYFRPNLLQISCSRPPETVVARLVSHSSILVSLRSDETTERSSVFSCSFRSTSGRFAPSVYFLFVFSSSSAALRDFVPTSCSRSQISSYLWSVVPSYPPFVVFVPHTTHSRDARNSRRFAPRVTRLIYSADGFCCAKPPIISCSLIPDHFLLRKKMIFHSFAWNSGRFCLQNPS